MTRTILLARPRNCATWIICRPFYKAIPAGVQHVLAMFVSNVTPRDNRWRGLPAFGFGSNSPISRT